MQMGKKRAELEFKYMQREKEYRILSDYSPQRHSPAGHRRRDAVLQRGVLEPRGLTHSDITSDGEAWLARIDPRDRERAQREWKQVAEGNQPTTVINYRWMTGRCMSAVVVRLDLVEPGLTGMLACFSDVTDSEERLHEAERRRIEAEESKRQRGCSST
jgi:hypothetical protein